MVSKVVGYVFLMELGAEIFGVSLKNDDPNSLFNKLGIKKNLSEKIIDIRNNELLEDTLADFSPDIVFHLAAQPLSNRKLFKTC